MNFQIRYFCYQSPDRQNVILLDSSIITPDLPELSYGDELDLQEGEQTTSFRVAHLPKLHMGPVIGQANNCYVIDLFLARSDQFDLFPVPRLNVEYID